MAVRVAINGFGRIGRLVLRAAFEHKHTEIEVVGVEAAVEFGWNRYLGDRGRFVGMHSFGASAPIEALYPHFGITAEAVVKAALALS